MSKTFTAIALMCLVSEGSMDLDAPVSQPRIDQRRSAAQALIASAARRGTELVAEARSSGLDPEASNETARRSLTAVAWSAAARLPSVAISEYRTAGSREAATKEESARSHPVTRFRVRVPLWHQYAPR
ncbi:beta-lactamase family protein [Streptomyces sp. SID9727]|nr:beta-lactamase family protein [Streptomyces sp. SID9727]